MGWMAYLDSLGSLEVKDKLEKYWAVLGVLRVSQDQWDAEET